VETWAQYLALKCFEIWEELGIISSKIDFLEKNNKYKSTMNEINTAS